MAIFFRVGRCSLRHWHSTWRVLFWIIALDLMLFRVEDFCLSAYFLGASLVSLKLPLYAMHPYAFSPFSGSIGMAVLFDAFCKLAVLSFFFLVATWLVQKFRKPSAGALLTTAMLAFLILRKEQEAGGCTLFSLLEPFTLIDGPDWRSLFGIGIKTEHVLYALTFLLFLPALLLAVCPIPAGPMRGGRKTRC